MPGADIGPTAGDGHDRGARGFFHDRIIDRDRQRLFERLRIERHEAETPSAPADGLANRRNTFGIDLAVFVEQYRGAEHEVAAVPEMPRADIGGGGPRIGVPHKHRDLNDPSRNYPPR